MRGEFFKIVLSQFVYRGKKKGFTDCGTKGKGYDDAI